ncbi:MAG TPA: hypothetical protein VIF62_30075 [Labilithrix sp.]
MSSSLFRRLASQLPDVEEGVACAGTALESRTYAAKKKTFLFVGKEHARLKLDASAKEAKKLGFAVGANGWVKIPLDEAPPKAVIERWVAESHALIAGGPTSPPVERKRAPRAQSKR